MQYDLIKKQQYPLYFVSIKKDGISTAFSNTLLFSKICHINWNGPTVRQAQFRCAIHIKD